MEKLKTMFDIKMSNCKFCQEHRQTLNEVCMICNCGYFDLPHSESRCKSKHSKIVNKLKLKTKIVNKIVNHSELKLKVKCWHCGSDQTIQNVDNVFKCTNCSGYLWTGEGGYNISAIKKEADLLGIDMKFEVRNDLTNKKMWVFSVTYADIDTGEKVWRSYPNFPGSGEFHWHTI